MVRLVHSVQLNLQAFYFLPSRDLDFSDGSVDQRLLDFGEWHAGWPFEPVRAVDGNSFISNWQWT